MSTREYADLVLALHRDVRWLEKHLRFIRDAGGANADRLREIAAVACAKAKARSKRTLSMQKRGA